MDAWGIFPNTFTPSSCDYMVRRQVSFMIIDEWQYIPMTNYEWDGSGLDIVSDVGDTLEKLFPEVPNLYLGVSIRYHPLDRWTEGPWREGSAVLV